MMATPSLKEQLEHCETSVKALMNLSDAIDIAKQNLNLITLVLQEELFQEYVAELTPLQEDFEKGSKEVQEFIQDYHIAYLGTQIEHISSRISQQTANTNNQQSS